MFKHANAIVTRRSDHIKEMSKASFFPRSSRCCVSCAFAAVAYITGLLWSVCVQWRRVTGRRSSAVAVQALAGCLNVHCCWRFLFHAKANETFPLWPTRVKLVSSAGTAIPSLAFNPVGIASNHSQRAKARRAHWRRVISPPKKIWFIPQVRWGQFKTGLPIFISPFTRSLPPRVACTNRLCAVTKIWDRGVQTERRKRYQLKK